MRGLGDGMGRRIFLLGFGWDLGGLSGERGEVVDLNLKIKISERFDEEEVESCCCGCEMYVCVS